MVMILEGCVCNRKFISRFPRHAADLELNGSNRAFGFGNACDFAEC